MAYNLICGDALEELKQLPDNYVQSIITSPPYWNQRDYGVPGQIGLEPLNFYLDRITNVFMECHRVLRGDGTLWLNIGDCYASGGRQGRAFLGDKHIKAQLGPKKPPSGLKPKDLVGLPWRIAFAMQEHGWYLRSEIIWHKPNPLPESVKDRPTVSHEKIFLLSKSRKYYYNADAIAEDLEGSSIKRLKQNVHAQNGSTRANGGAKTNGNMKAVCKNLDDKGKRTQGFHISRANGIDLYFKKKNKRSVWKVATRPFKQAHFAVFPESLVEPCILAGSRVGDLILDPFVGSGTCGIVACRFGREFFGVDINQEYIDISRKRIETEVQKRPLFINLNNTKEA